MLGRARGRLEAIFVKRNIRTEYIRLEGRSEQISIELTSVGLAPARPNYTPNILTMKNLAEFGHS